MTAADGQAWTLAPSQPRGSVIDVIYHSVMMLVRTGVQVSQWELMSPLQPRRRRACQWGLAAAWCQVRQSHDDFHWHLISSQIRVINAEGQALGRNSEGSCKAEVRRCYITTTVVI